MVTTRTIDIHTHILTQETAALLSQAGAKVTITPDDAESAALDVGGVVYRPFPTGGFDIARRLQDMDATGIDVHVLSATPQTYLYKQEAALGATTSAIQNDQIAKHIAAHPTRFMGIATLPMQDPKRAADELTRAMTKLGLRGAMFASNILGKNLDDPSFEPLWAAAEELGAFMFIHPNNVAGAERLKSYYLVNLIGNPLDTTIAAACLVFGGVMDRHPRLKVCLAHAGGFMPYQAGRWIHGWRVRPEPKKNIPQAAGHHRRPLPLRHHRAFRRIARLPDRAGGRRPGHAGQRLSLRYGDDGLRRARARPQDIRRRQGGDPRQPRAKLFFRERPDMDAKTTKRTPVVAVSGLIVEAMSKAGLPAGDAAKVAELMLEADLTGSDAHGVFRLPQYVHAAQARGDQCAPEHQGHALGAGDRAGRRRQRHGPSGGRARGGNRDRTRARNRRRLGRRAHVEPCRRRRRLCRAAAQGRHDRPVCGGRQRQPHAARRRRRAAARHQSAGDRDPGRRGAAAGARHRHLDRVLRHHQEPPAAGHPVAAELDGRSEKRRGRHRSRSKSAEALLLPMAGYKGAGLALMFGMLAGTLNGALFGRDCIDFNAQPDAVTNTGQFVVALDPARFQPIEQFKAEVDRHSRELRASAALPGESVRLPGEQRAQRRADRLANGLALPAELHVELDKMAAELAIKPLAAR